MKLLGKNQSQSSLLTKNLVIFTVLSLLIGSLGLMLLFSTPWKTTTVYQALNGFLRFKQGGDSWGPMNKAWEYFNESPDKNLYGIFLTEGVKFQYPPASLLVIRILAKVSSILRGFSVDLLVLDLLNFISWCSVVIGVFLSVKLFTRNLKEDAQPTSTFESIIRIVCLVCLGFTFYPFLQAYNLGQIQVWLNAAFAGVLWCWIADRKELSGFIVGVMCLIKPQYFVIFFWGLIRQQWRFAIAALASLGGGLLVSAISFGIPSHFEYLKVLSVISRHGEAYYPNQSINGLLNRLFFNGNNLTFDRYAFPPFNGWIYAATVLTSVVILGLALLPPKHRSEHGSMIDFVTISLASTMASPLAWEHHYGILLPIYAVLVPYLLANPIFGRLTVPYLAISYVLCSNFLVFLNQFAAIPVLNIVQSYLLAGALMVLVCLYLLKCKKPLRIVPESNNLDPTNLPD